MKRYETADIFDRLRFSKTVRDLCRDGLQLVRDQLNCSRVFVFLNETPADSGEPFYGFYGVDQPIEKKEDVLRLMKSVSEVASSSSVLKRETEVIDFCGKVLGQADQLCIQITLPGGGALGWFAADNFTDKKEWDPGSIEFVQTFSA
ncbi:MAG: hypothetical protein MUC65_09130, partial [Pontiellaceae bacterium]|nr:hypothetical protein [Pontiellaceae bacterium]